MFKNRVIFATLLSSTVIWIHLTDERRLWKYDAHRVEGSNFNDLDFWIGLFYNKSRILKKIKLLFL